MIASGLTGNSYGDSGLTDGVTYYYVVTASNGGGTSGYSNQASATPQAAGPPAPTNLVAVAGDQQVSLTWSSSQGANSYSVLRSTTSGSGYAPIATGLTATSYVDIGLTDGTTYFYVTTATGAAGTSGYSNQAAATPEPLPTYTIGGYLVTLSGGSNSLGWPWTVNANGQYQLDIYNTTQGGPPFGGWISGPTTAAFAWMGQGVPPDLTVVQMGSEAYASSVVSAPTVNDGWNDQPSPMWGPPQDWTESVGSQYFSFGQGSSGAFSISVNPTASAVSSPTAYDWQTETTYTVGSVATIAMSFSGATPDGSGNWRIAPGQQLQVSLGLLGLSRSPLDTYTWAIGSSEDQSVGGFKDYQPDGSGSLLIPLTDSDTSAETLTCYLTSPKGQAADISITCIYYNAVLNQRFVVTNTGEPLTLEQPQFAKGSVAWAPSMLFVVGNNPANFQVSTTDPANFMYWGGSVPNQQYKTGIWHEDTVTDPAGVAVQKGAVGSWSYVQTLDSYTATYRYPGQIYAQGPFTCLDGLGGQGGPGYYPGSFPYLNVGPSGVAGAFNDTPGLGGTDAPLTSRHLARPSTSTSITIRQTAGQRPSTYRSRPSTGFFQHAPERRPHNPGALGRPPRSARPARPT